MAFGGREKTGRRLEENGEGEEKEGEDTVGRMVWPNRRVKLVPAVRGKSAGRHNASFTFLEEEWAKEGEWGGQQCVSLELKLVFGEGSVTSLWGITKCLGH